jgi:DNA primase
MNKITIEVDSDIQEAFEQASEAEKQEIKSLISIFFRQSLANKNLVEVMEEINTRAETRGLTSEILANILANE